MNNEFSLNAAREARIDRAIDRAVREMMQVDPPPGLRRRVLARLNESDKHRGPLLPRFAFAALAVVVLLLSATQFWYRSDAPTPPKPPDLAKMLAPRAIEVPTPVREFTGPDIPDRQITTERIRMPRVTNVFENRVGEVTAATINGGKQEIVLPALRIVPLSARPVVIELLVLPASGR
jgi:hypothetical protein